MDLPTTVVDKLWTMVETCAGCGKELNYQPNIPASVKEAIQLAVEDSPNRLDTVIFKWTKQDGFISERQADNG